MSLFCTLGGSTPKSLRELEGLLQHFVDRGLFPTDPNIVPACVGGGLPKSLISENRKHASIQEAFTPEGVEAIRLEISKLTERTVLLGLRIHTG